MKLTPTACAVALLTLTPALFAQTGMERREGFIPMIWDSGQGRLLFEISKFDQDVLYYTEVAKGSGSGNVGLEWAADGEGGVIQFQRVGPKVLVVEKNLRFRPGNGRLARWASSHSPACVRTNSPCPAFCRTRDASSRAVSTLAWGSSS